MNRQHSTKLRGSALAIVFLVLLGVVAVDAVNVRKQRQNLTKTELLFEGFVDAVHQRCVDSQPAAALTHTYRLAQIAYLRKSAVQEQSNRFIDDKLRKERVDNFNRLADATQKILDAYKVEDCEQYVFVAPDRIVP
jgi:hypothetical protein